MLVSNNDYKKEIEDSDQKNKGSFILRNYILNDKYYSDLKKFSYYFKKNNNFYSYLEYLNNHLNLIYQNKQQIEIVLARYNENMEWAIYNHNFLTIYNKGDKIDSYVSKNKGLIKFYNLRIKNVGRESHTYLYHIINNWDNLADNTFFGQGKLTSDHRPFPLSLYLIPKNENITINLYIKGVKLDNNNRFIHLGKYYNNLSKGYMRPAKLNFIDWWKRYIKYPYPGENNIIWSHGAIFSVKSKLIKNHPKEYYEDLISCISDHPDPEEGHYFERAWFYIFNLGLLKTN